MTRLLSTMTASEDLRIVLSGVFGESQERLGWAISKYRELYDLPQIEQIDDVEPRMFQFFRRGEHFVVLALCNEAGEVYVLQEAAGENHVHKLVGGFIHQDESIEATIDRLVQSETGFSIDSIEPLAFVTNRFRCNHREVIHSGLAFMIQVRGTPRQTDAHQGTFLSNCPPQLAYANKRIAELAFDRLGDRRRNQDTDEIDINRSQKYRYWIHKTFVSPIFNLFSSAILRRKVLKYCVNLDSVIDVACGNDTLILELAKSARLAVANDISWDVTSYLRERNTSENVLFTNHSALSLPFRKRFDTVICKNVLHHMHNLAEFEAITETLAAIGKRIIVVDVEHPRKSTFLARLWNQYYVTFLKDRGQYFLTRHEFQSAMRLIFSDANVDFDFQSTIKGVYMIAVVDLAPPVEPR